ncbi:hypothetical protein K493DRAFT_300649 [Basidiobolus meristosporus CBS 931.73]|uniref:Uncharacterized protein n=1 Tax=Basidiobolus meristosporus CBS 931.73 TaxID=1314790 RepID=A0A1Y1YG86_9FUNG|nr:hypothetical protein K493DRAFT_300649 [Basidiobolus meristosporus CBS 931.73]|eukprot:ORX96995.1 hypothetical protein K493DRAFT_300649 [Basidiobolus meristosporus CBS 931.73]
MPGVKVEYKESEEGDKDAEEDAEPGAEEEEGKEVAKSKRSVKEVLQQTWMMLSKLLYSLPGSRSTKFPKHCQRFDKSFQNIGQHCTMRYCNRRGDIVKLNWDIAGLQAQIDFSFHHSTEALVAQMVEKFASIRASNKQGASSNPGVLASDSIGGDTTSSLEPTTSQETRAESSTTMRMVPMQVDMEVCKEDVEKQSGDTIGQPETVMEAERPSRIVILKMPQVDSSLSLPPSSLSVPPSPPPSSG